MLTAVLVELDGVLVDTRAARADAVAAAFATTSLAHLAEDPAGSTADDVVDDLSSSIEQYVRAVAAARARAGDPAASALDDTALALVVLQAEREYRARLAAGVTLVAGARELMEALATTAQLAAVTAWQRADAERVLEHAGLGASVRFIAAANDGPGFASPSGRYARAVTRVRKRTTARSDAQPCTTASTTTVAALVAGAAGFAAAQAAGAHPVLVTSRLPLRDLTPARLTAALDTVSLVAPSQPQTAPRR